MDVKLNLMCIETGIPVLEIIKALNIELLPEIRIKSSDVALSLLQRFEGNDYLQSQVIKQWREVAVKEVKLENCAFKLKSLYKKIPDDFIAKKFAFGKINELLIKQCYKENTSIELKATLLCSEPSWPSYEIINNKLQKVYDDLADKAKTISEMKEIYTTCMNFIERKKRFFKKWDILVLEDLSKATSFSDYINIHDNSDSALESFSETLRLLKKSAINELNNSENTVFNLQDVLEKLPLKFELIALYEKKIDDLLQQDVNKAKTFSEIEEVEDKYIDFSLFLQKTKKRREEICQSILKKRVEPIDLVTVYNSSNNQETRNLAIKKLAKFYKA